MADEPQDNVHHEHDLGCGWVLAIGIVCLTILMALDKVTWHHG